MAPANDGRPGNRKIQREYIDLTRGLVADKDAIIDLSNTKFNDYMTRANRAQEAVDRPKEAAQDAAVFATLVNYGHEAIKKVANNNVGKNLFDLIVALRSHYVGGPNPQQAVQEDPGAFRWDDLAKVAAQTLQAAPGVNCMLGPMDAQAKARKAPAARARRAELAPLVRPEEIVPAQEADKQETDRNMEEMFLILEDLPGKTCPVAELICNHASFSQTIENLFTLSFLVRDSKVRLLHDAQQGMVACVYSKKAGATQQQAAAAATEQAQFVIDLTLEDWKDMCAIVNKKDCKMKHRDNQDQYENVLNKRQRKA